MQSFCCLDDHIITEWAYQILKLRSNALFLKFVFEGGYDLEDRGADVTLQ